MSGPTGERGRVVAKMHHGLVRVALDVPDDEVLAAWGTAARKPLAGHVTFFGTDRRTARETLSWAAGECVGYHESFAAGDTGGGAYVCQLVIAAGKLVLTPGGPPRPLAAATPRDYATAAVPTTLAPLATVAGLSELSKQQRYDARMSLMGNAQGKLAGTPDATAQAALNRLGLDNVAVERAKLSEHVYHILEKPPVPEPEGWHRLTPAELAKKGITPEMLLNDKSGFKASLYESSFERPPKLVIAYAGTENEVAGVKNKIDWKADARQGLGLREAQYDRAMNLARNLAKKVNKRDFEITGHSLGGGLASAGSVVTGAKGYTFNSAGLHRNTVRRTPYGVGRDEMLEKGGLIAAYRSTSDPLNNTQNFLSKGPDARIAPRALGIDYPLEPAPQWRHSLAELNPLHPKKAFKSVIDRGMHGHGISPQMVDHIEHRKDQDTATLTNYLTP